MEKEIDSSKDMYICTNTYTIYKLEIEAEQRRLRVQLKLRLWREIQRRFRVQLKMRLWREIEKSTPGNIEERSRNEGPSCRREITSGIELYAQTNKSTSLS